MYITWLCSLALFAAAGEKEQPIPVSSDLESAYVSTVIYFKPSEIEKAEFIIPDNLNNPIVNTIIKK